jgi:hypothetical protein
MQSGLDRQTFLLPIVHPATTPLNRAPIKGMQRENAFACFKKSEPGKRWLLTL